MGTCAPAEATAQYAAPAASPAAAQRTEYPGYGQAPTGPSLYGNGHAVQPPLSQGSYGNQYQVCHLSLSFKPVVEGCTDSLDFEETHSGSEMGTSWLTTQP